jgi:hypothetical protein
LHWRRSLRSRGSAAISPAESLVTSIAALDVLAERNGPRRGHVNTTMRLVHWIGAG